MCGVVCGVRLREEQRLRASEDRVLRKVCASERGSNKEAGENCVVRICIVCIVRQVSLRSAGQGWLEGGGEEGL
jgi:heterodisulfide reductase subunit B